jgi:hypothetical protein
MAFKTIAMKYIYNQIYIIIFNECYIYKIRLCFMKL